MKHATDQLLQTVFHALILTTASTTQTMSHGSRLLLTPTLQLILKLQNWERSRLLNTSLNLDQSRALVEPVSLVRVMRMDIAQSVLPDAHLVRTINACSVKKIISWLERELVIETAWLLALDATPVPRLNALIAMKDTHWLLANVRKTVFLETDA